MLEKERRKRQGNGKNKVRGVGGAPWMHHQRGCILYRVHARTYPQKVLEDPHHSIERRKEQQKKKNKIKERETVQQEKKKKVSH